jgi:CubicO group peptidase (beta-lactamase class C family)
VVDSRRRWTNVDAAAVPTMCFVAPSAGSWQDELESLADEGGFSGVVAVSRDGDRLVSFARGLADRANGRPITLGTRFGLASVAKGLTALTVASLVESGEMTFETTLRRLRSDVLPLVDPGVTIEHLLAHTSGVGDYFDEETLGDTDEYVLTIPVHRLATPEDYIAAIDGFPQRTPPGERFAYNNGGYVMLAVAIEAATGRSYHDLVKERVLDPAGMADTAFVRSDDLPADAALGYLEDGRTNILHLPVRGVGDGGVYSTVADLETLWAALFAGRIVTLPMVERLIEPRGDDPDEGRRYGMGFWLRPERTIVMLEGMDAGVSCRTACDRTSGLTYTVISNTSSGAWPLVAWLDERFPDASLADRSA